MARPRSKEKFNIYELSSSPCWYFWYVSDKTEKVVRRSTGYSKDEYTRNQVQEIIDGELGTKHVEKNSIAWLEEHTCLSLELEDIFRREN